MPGPTAGRRTGVLVDWDDARGFGFISSADDRRRLFAHVSEFPSGRRPVAGDEVTYAVGPDARGRPSATAVRYVGRVRTAGPRQRAVARALAVAMLFLAAVAGLAAVGRLPGWVLLAYAGAGAVTFLTYAHDKSAARAGRQRVAESTLHLQALVGGWPGALVAQQVLRHKTRKQPFRTVFWCTAVVNTAAVAALVLA